jgi:hypothetical protein
MHIQTEKLKALFKHSNWHFLVSTGAIWKYTIVFFVVLNLIQFGIYFSVWNSINKETFFQPEIAPLAPAETINRKALDSIIKDFEAKEILFDKLKANAPQIADPSR